MRSGGVFPCTNSIQYLTIMSLISGGNSRRANVQVVTLQAVTEHREPNGVSCSFESNTVDSVILALKTLQLESVERSIVELWITTYSRTQLMMCVLRTVIPLALPSSIVLVWRSMFVFAVD